MPNVPCDPNWRNTMTQSDPASLRDALLNQARTGNQAVDAGLAHLRQLVEAEQARVRRLTRWTKVVWIGIAALPAGECCVTGYTGSADFPTRGGLGVDKAPSGPKGAAGVNAAFQPLFGG